MSATGGRSCINRLPTSRTRTKFLCHVITTRRFDRSDQKTRIHVVTLLSPGLWDRQAERLSLYDVERSGHCLLAKDNSQTCSLCATYCAVSGGAERDRTADLKLAKLPLSQLSYGPMSMKLVGPGRLELPTLRLSGVRSNHLSYGPSGSRQGSRQLAGQNAANIAVRDADA